MGSVDGQADAVLRQRDRRPHQQRSVTRARQSRRARGERASAAVEFALVLPLVLLMAVALVQVGLLVKDQLVVAGAARAGARQGAVSTDDDEVRQAAVQAAASLDETRLDVVVDRQGGAGAPVVVTVRYDVPPVLPWVTWLFPAQIELSSAVTFRQEVE
ncbi:MAG: TadE/TadG family type IV pilus assembly protein [Actinomycetota bacterium]